MKKIEFMVMLLSIIGAGIMSFGFFEGFYFYLIANVLGTVLFLKKKMYYMLIMQIVFSIIAVNGIYQNLL
jgi:nicotinamide riboside transporter PnuC